MELSVDFTTCLARPVAKTNMILTKHELFIGIYNLSERNQQDKQEAILTVTLYSS